MSKSANQIINEAISANLVALARQLEGAMNQAHAATLAMADSNYRLAMGELYSIKDQLSLAQSLYSGAMSLNQGRLVQP